MKRQGSINPVRSAVAAFTLLASVAGCAVSPPGERSTSPIPSDPPTVTGADETHSPVPLTTPSSSTLGASASPAYPDPTPDPTPEATPIPTPEPTPRPTPSPTPQASRTSGPIRIDELALVVVDGLRVRSAPGTDAASSIRGEPLTKGREVLVVAGPEPANGYLWWQVAVLTGSAQFGWIAAAGRDGEIWLAPAAVPCPKDPSIADLARLGGARSLACYGRSDLQVRAFRQQLCGDGSHNLEAWSPAWITSPFGYDELFDREPDWPDQTGLKIHSRAHPSFSRSAPSYFDCSGEGTGWFDVTGHFDDPLASDCRITYYDLTSDESVEEEPALSITGCRQKFVYTELRPASGP